MSDWKRLDRYWRLKSYEAHQVYELKKKAERAGYALSKSPSRSLLLDRLKRRARGDLVYDKCSTEELQEFLAARRLRMRDKRDVAIRALHVADDHARFQTFLELPPELRNRVYDFYFADIPEKMRPGVQPPLTKASPLIRSETLPIFYGRTTFQLRFFRRKSAPYKCLRPTNDVDLFLNKISMPNFRLLRKVQIEVDLMCFGDADGDESFFASDMTCILERSTEGFSCKFQSRLGPEDKRSDPEGIFAATLGELLRHEDSLSAELIYTVRQKLESFLW